MSITASIVISSYNRLPLLRRTLWAIANRGPSVPYEVILVDDNSTENVLGELKLYSSKFRWKFIRFQKELFEAATGLKKFLNNPCVTNNIGFIHSKGQVIFQQGNEVIPWEGCYDKMLDDAPNTVPYWMVMSTTYDMPAQHLNRIDEYGSNLSQGHVDQLIRWPLQSAHYRSDVTNYISLSPAKLWYEINGYDERYYGGISAEDSDFVRRARTLPDFTQVISEGVSIHQFHNGKTCYYNPPPSLITQEKWKEGVQINHAIYNSWNGKSANPQKWPIGHYGVQEILSNWD